jgi:hypothetical protein
MKPETLEAIKNMTGEFAKELSKFIDSKDTIKMSNNGINGVITGIFTKHITKYAELLESEREKSEKLCEAVKSLLLICGHPTSEIYEDAKKVFDEYKTTSK